MKKYYLVTADIAQQSYSTNNYLFGIFESEEEALNFIKEWKPKKGKSYYDDPMKFDFLKSLKNIKKYMASYKDKSEDDVLKELFIEKFDGNPMCVGAYFE